jgi:hypothetical protein
MQTEINEENMFKFIVEQTVQNSVDIYKILTGINLDNRYQSLKQKRAAVESAFDMTKTSILAWMDAVIENVETR